MKTVALGDVGCGVDEAGGDSEHERYPGEDGHYPVYRRSAGPGEDQTTQWGENRGYADDVHFGFGGRVTGFVDFSVIG